jgi:hypothetical protein
MLLLGTSYYCRNMSTTCCIGAFARLPQRGFRFGRQTLCGVHVGADTLWQIALNILLLVKALTLRRLFKGAI